MVIPLQITQDITFFHLDVSLWQRPIPWVLVLISFYPSRTIAFVYLDENRAHIHTRSKPPLISFAAAIVIITTMSLEKALLSKKYNLKKRQCGHGQISD